MAQCVNAIILSAMLVCFNLNVYSIPILTNVNVVKDKDYEPTTFLSFRAFVFVVAIFFMIAAVNINIFTFELSPCCLFFYEFLVSLFLFEMALHMMWKPLEVFLTKTLPPLCEQLLLQDGGCAVFGLYCQGHSVMFEFFANLLALGFFWCAVFGFGVLQRHDPVLEPQAHMFQH